MLTRLRQKLIDLQGNFSYRQRFLMLGFIFFLVFPPTLYVILKPLNEQYHDISKGERGLAYQREAIGVLDLSQQYIVFLVELQHLHESHRSRLRQQENNIESKLIDHQHPGFDSSGLKETLLFDENVIFYWKKFIDSIHAGDKSSIVIHYDLYIESLLESIQTNGKWSLLYGNTDAASSFILQFIWDFLLPSARLYTDIILLENEADPSKVSMQKHNRIERLNIIIQRAKIALKRNFLLIDNGNKQDVVPLEELKSRSLIYFDHLEDIINKPALSFKQSFEVFDFFHEGTLIQTMGLDIVNTRLMYKKYLFQILFWVNMTVFFVAAFIITIFVVFRVLTTHLTVLIEDAKKIALGIPGKCSCSNDKDQFGEVGRAFESVSVSMTSITKELHVLNSKLLEATSKIAITIQNQESKAIGSENRIKEIERAIDTISHETRQLSEGMQQLCSHISQKVLNLNTKENFESIETKIGELGIRSQKSVISLENLQNKMHQLGNQINFMNKVSENANLLSLNAAIETAQVAKHKESFESISDKIQRFAVKTVQSTEDIKLILGGMTANVSSLKNSSLKCLHEISVGANEFIHFSYQLSDITVRGQKQLDEFQIFKDRIQSQATETVNMINSISKLRQMAEHNSQYISQIHLALGEFSAVTSELSGILQFIERNK